MFKITRTTYLNKVMYDDLCYTLALLYAISDATGKTFQFICKSLEKDDLERFFECACVKHCLPFKEDVLESIQDCFPDLLCSLEKVNFNRAWENSYIYASVIKEVFFRTKESVTVIFIS